MSKNIKISLIPVIALAAGLAWGVHWCWKTRLTPEARLTTNREVLRTVRTVKNEDIGAYLRDLAFTRYFHTWFDNSFPYMHVAWETKVPPELVAQMTEDAFLRFVGKGENGADDIPRLKEMIAFAEEFMAGCKDAAAPGFNDLRDRLLDAYFLVGDYDGAIAIMEAGMPGHDKGWLVATIAKVKAHRALHRAAQPGLDAEAVKQAKREAMDNFTAFGEYMTTDVMKDFEDCDPSTGVVYSPEWVSVKNFLRSAKLAREIGDVAKAEELRARAMKYLPEARKKASDDTKSLEMFEADMKSYGL